MGLKLIAIFLNCLQAPLNGQAVTRGLIFLIKRLLISDHKSLIFFSRSMIANDLPFAIYFAKP